jgi:hypothetical protein
VVMGLNSHPTEDRRISLYKTVLGIVEPQSVIDLEAASPPPHNTTVIGSRGRARLRAGTGSKVLAERQLRREISSATGAIPSAAVVLEILKKCIVGEVCDPRRGLRYPERAR